MTAARLIRSPRRLICIVLALLGLCAAPVAAQVSSCALLPMRTDLRPNAGGPPVEVGVGLLVADIRAVDDARASLIGDFVISLDWIDHRLTGLAGCRFPVDAVWSPDIRPFNASSLLDAQAGARDRFEVGAGGYVSYVRRLSGAIVTGHRLHRFPFDRHDFTIRIGALDDGPEEIALRSAEDRSLRAERLSLEGWRFGELRVETRVEPSGVSAFAASFRRRCRPSACRGSTSSASWFRRWFSSASAGRSSGSRPRATRSKSGSARPCCLS